MNSTESFISAGKWGRTRHQFDFPWQIHQVKLAQSSLWRGHVEMREVGAFEAKNKLGQLLDQVERGEEITITRHGKQIARLVPVKPGFNREEARAAVHRI